MRRKKQTCHQQGTTSDFCVQTSTDRSARVAMVTTSASVTQFSGDGFPNTSMSCQNIWTQTQLQKNGLDPIYNIRIHVFFSFRAVQTSLNQTRYVKICISRRPLSRTSESRVTPVNKEKITDFINEVLTHQSLRSLEL